MAGILSFLSARYLNLISLNAIRKIQFKDFSKEKVIYESGSEFIVFFLDVFVRG